jgi:hypothetical protein
MLRLFGYGENYELFHKVISENNIEYYEMNSDISKKYFKNTGFRSDNQSDLFLKNKSDSTFRIFVQGASTVVGFPFYKNGSFPRILKHRLSRYASFDSGNGAKFEEGDLSLEEISKIAREFGEPKQLSGKQELYEQIIANSY